MLKKDSLKQSGNLEILKTHSETQKGSFWKQHTQSGNS